MKKIVVWFLLCGVVFSFQHVAPLNSKNLYHLMMGVRPYTTVMIVPTATIGGFAGDALPAARLLASDIDPKVQRLSKSFLSTVVRVPVGRSVLQQQPILGQFGRFFSSTPETGPVNPLIDLDLIIKTPTPTTVKIMSDSIDDLSNSIDITLTTPEQQEHVNMLKKKCEAVLVLRDVITAICFHYPFFIFFFALQPFTEKCLKKMKLWVSATLYLKWPRTRQC